MNRKSKRRSEPPVLSTWNAYQQIDLIVWVAQDAIRAIERELNATKCNREALRRRVAILVMVANSFERARDDLERSVER
mgnify:CR=1 FL=1